MSGKILEYGHVCLFCGEPLQKKYEEYTEYYECDCPDAVLNRNIDRQINQLNMGRPKEKYAVRTRKVLEKIR